MKSFVRLFFVAAILAAGSVNAETVERRGEANPKGTVEISNIAGEVRVTAWDRAEVFAKADLGRGVEKLEFERRGDLTLIKVIYPSRGNSGGTILDVQVPRDSAIKTTTVSADQTIQGVRGSQRLNTVSGDIKSQVLSDEFYAKSVSGQITITGADGASGASRVRVQTVSGDIEAAQLRDDIELQTVSGSIVASTSDISRASIKTTNGEAKLTASLNRDARIEAESINGELTLELLGKVDASFDIETFNGSIDNCFGQKAVRVSEYGPGKELRFKEGGGSAQVRIKTLNGGIDLCRK